MKNPSNVKKNINPVSRTRTPTDYAAAIEAVERRFNAPPPNHHKYVKADVPLRVALCKLWLRVHARRSGRTINYQMSAFAIGCDVQRWIFAANGLTRLYTFAAADVIAAATEIGYTAVSGGVGFGMYFNVVPK